ncbi:MAG TPA: hypothetical protein VIH59_26765 [Candidatus Tectomicrobia bacterium]|jgi:hypothetical protein
MKKTLIVLLSLVTLGFTHQALAKGPQGTRSMERLTEALNLEQSQVGQVEQILKEQRDKRQALWEAQREQMRPQMQAIHDETIERLRTVLSDEQLQTFLDMTKAHRAERLPGAPGELRRPRQ